MGSPILSCPGCGAANSYHSILCAPGSPGSSLGEGDESPLPLCKESSPAMELLDSPTTKRSAVNQEPPCQNTASLPSPEHLLPTSPLTSPLLSSLRDCRAVELRWPPGSSPGAHLVLGPANVPYSMFETVCTSSKPAHTVQDWALSQVEMAKQESQEGVMGGWTRMDGLPWYIHLR